MEAGLREERDELAETGGRPRIASNYLDLAQLMDYWGPRRLNHHTEVEGGVLAERCSRLLSAFFAERRALRRAGALPAEAEAIDGEED